MKRSIARPLIVTRLPPGCGRERHRFIAVLQGLTFPASRSVSFA